MPEPITVKPIDMAREELCSVGKEQVGRLTSGHTSNSSVPSGGPSSIETDTTNANTLDRFQSACSRRRISDFVQSAQQRMISANLTSRSFSFLHHSFFHSLHSS